MAVADLEEDTCLDNVDYKYVKRLSELDQQGSTGFPCWYMLSITYTNLF